MLESDVGNFIFANDLIRSEDRVLVGVSGGADSVGLLVLLDQIKATLKFQVFAGHLNHQLRGPAAEEDEGFVKDLTQQLNIPFYAERQDIPAIRAQRGGSVEETARAVRYEFYLRASRHFSAKKIALAHHRDDQCETILFNMLRGSSVHGLRGIPVKRELNGADIIRPLLDVSRNEIEEYLRSKGIEWRVDHTNLEPCTSRNALRLKVLPVLEEVNPSFREHLLFLGRQAGEIEKLLGEQAKRVLAAGHHEGNEIRIEQWRVKTLPEITACEVVREMLAATGARMGRITARHLHDIAHLETKLELPDGWVARVEYGRLIIGPKRTTEKDDNVTVLAIGKKCRFGRYEISAEVKNYDEKAFKEFLRTKDPSCEWIDAGKVSGRLEVRYARDGERFHPLGAPGSKKVNDFLTDVKAGWSARPAMVITDEKGIIWLAGRRIDERVKADRNTKKVLGISAVFLPVGEKHE
jgi:tRNA(Ile)-lysidine synthase